MNLRMRPQLPWLHNRETPITLSTSTAIPDSEKRTFFNRSATIYSMHALTPRCSTSPANGSRTNSLMRSEADMVKNLRIRTGTLMCCFWTTSNSSRGEDAGGFFPHVRDAPSKEQTARHHFRPLAERHPRTRKPAPFPPRVGNDLRRIRAGLRNTRRDSRSEARERRRARHDILRTIAGTIQVNVRELEGALNKILAYHQFKNTIPTVDSVQRFSKFRPEHAKMLNYAATAYRNRCGYFDLSMNDMLGKSREQRRIPRQIAMYLLREEAKCSFPPLVVTWEDVITPRPCMRAEKSEAF